MNASYGVRACAACMLACGTAPIAAPAAPSPPIEQAPTSPPVIVDPPAPVATSVAPADLPKGKGWLPPEIIQPIVRKNFGAMRLCFESRLQPCPSLQGRVSIKFVIDRDGRVRSAVDDKSDLPDTEIVQCVAGEFKKLRFPQPVGSGQLTVSYPIIFDPGE